MLEAQKIRRERVATYTREGKSAAEIAAILGITDRSVTRIRSELGITRPATWVPMSEERIRRAGELLADGCSQAEAARSVGCSSDTIRRYFPGLGWPPGEGARFAVQLRWAEYRVRQAYANV